MGYDAADFAGKPAIAIINTWSEINPCHAHLRERAEWVKRGVLQMLLAALLLGYLHDQLLMMFGDAVIHGDDILKIVVVIKLHFNNHFTCLVRQGN